MQSSQLLPFSFSSNGYPHVGQDFRMMEVLEETDVLDLLLVIILPLVEDWSESLRNEGVLSRFS